MKRTALAITIAFPFLICATAFAYNPGDRVQCTGANVNVRNTSCSVIGQVNSPTQAPIQYSGSGCSGCADPWYLVNWDSGINGWTCSTFYAPVSCTAPTAITNNASPVGTTTATLNGIVTPNGCTTTAYFQYGLTTSYGSMTPNQTFNGTNSQLVTQISAV